METVAFITNEITDDLVVSFAVGAPEEFGDMECLFILRTPKFEHFLEEWERGAAVSFHREEKDLRDLLLEVHYSPGEKYLRLQTQRHVYDLDLRKVDREEIAEMGTVFRKINFDGSLKLSGI